MELNRDKIKIVNLLKKKIEIKKKSSIIYMIYCIFYGRRLNGSFKKYMPCNYGNVRNIRG